jgi:hypothetical protein
MYIYIVCIEVCMYVYVCYACISYIYTYTHTQIYLGVLTVLFTGRGRLSSQVFIVSICTFVLVKKVNWDHLCRMTLSRSWKTISAKRWRWRRWYNGHRGPVTIREYVHIDIGCECHRRPQSLRGHRYSQFTSFTSTKVQILTLRVPPTTSIPWRTPDGGNDVFSPPPIPPLSGVMLLLTVQPPPTPEY